MYMCMHDNRYQSLMGFSRNTSTKGGGSMDQHAGKRGRLKKITRIAFAVTSQMSDVRPGIAKVWNNFM